MIDNHHIISYNPLLKILMTDYEDWIQGRLKLHEHFRLSREFRAIEHSYMLFAVAPNGGPIAVTSDKQQVLSVTTNDPTIQNLCLFDNQGDMMYKTPIENYKREIVVCFEFLQDERLLAVFQKAYYYLIDPYSGSRKKVELKGILKDGETILEAKVVGNGFGFISSMFKFKLIADVSQPVVKEFYENQLVETPSHWSIYLSRDVSSQSIEINYPHPKAGIIQIFENNKRKEDVRKRIIYNKEMNKQSGPDIPYVTYISEISPNARSIVFFCATPVYKPVPQALKPKKNDPPPPPPVPESYSYRLIVTLADGSSTSHKNLELKRINEEFLNQNRCPKKIIWCGDDTIIIQYFNHQIYILTVPEFEMIRMETNRSKEDDFAFLRQEVDGVRMISKDKNRILRKIPKSYENVFGMMSQKPSALLYQTYESFKAKQALQDDDIKKDKKKLTDAVLDCIDASKYEESEQVCSQLLKAASYGKTFLPPNIIPNNSIMETCKKMRVLNEIRIKLKRVMTFAQFEALSEQGLLRILLRYNLHYLAFEIFRFLNKSLDFRIQIYSHWALCKIQSEDTDDKICEDIKRQFEDQKGVSFTQMAYKAIESGKLKLALKLLKEEPSLAKKVPLLLWMGTESNDFIKYFNKAIAAALESFDPDLLCLCIQEIRTSEKLNDIELFKLFSENLESKYTLISYYRIFDKSMLIKYYDLVKEYDNLGLFCLNQGYQAAKYADQLKFMEAALAKFNLESKNPLNEWRKPALVHYISLYSNFIKNFPKAENRGDGGGKIGVKLGPINELIDIFIARNNVDEVDSFKSLYQIPDKRIILSRIRSLISQGKFQELQRTIDQFQKKFKLPVVMFASMVMQRGQTGWGLRILSRIPDKEKKQEYELLSRIGKVKEAIDAATRRKDYQGLLQMKDSIQDLKLLAHLNEQLGTIAPKKK